MKKIDYSDFDPECVNICKAVNRLNGIFTIESCCEHNNQPFWLVAGNLLVRW